MAKGISSYPKEQQKSVVLRRLKNNTGGLGYLAALDAKRYYKDL
jgi:hypothetical protein